MNSLRSHIALLLSRHVRLTDANSEGAKGPLPREILLVLLCAAVVRVGYLFEYLAQLPYSRGPVGDSLVYLLQAREILHGQFGTPAQLSFSPLYGYFLALTSDGQAAILPIVLQLALGVFNVLLISIFTRNLFGRAVAMAAALLACGYAPLMFLESKLLAETLGLTLALSTVTIMTLEGFRRRHWIFCLSAGALFGLSILARANYLFCLPFLVVLSMFSWSKDDFPLSIRLGRALLLAVAATLVLTCNGAWNYRNSGEFVMVIYASNTLESSVSAPASDTLENVKQGQGMPSAFDVVRQSMQRKNNHDTSQESNLVERFVRLDWKALAHALPGKLVRTFSNGEIFFQYGFLGERESVRVLRFMPVSWGCLGVLSLAGVALLSLQGRLRSLFPLLPWFAGALATTVLYHPSTRYRLPMVIPLLALAAVGLTQWGSIRQPRLRVVLALGTGLVTSFLLLQALTLSLRNKPEWYLQLAGSCYNAGDVKCTHKYARLAYEAAPNDVRVLERVRWLVRPRPAHQTPFER